MKPLISIIIPTYNRRFLIAETLNSVFEQTYTNWECIVIDDGSEDDSIVLINSFVEKDVRFRLLKRPFERKKGASSCRNIGLENANGEFIQFLDSDDLLSKNKLEQQINSIINFDKNVIAICKWGRFKEEINEAVLYENFEAYNNFDNILNFLDALKNSKGYFPIHAYLIKSSLIKQIGFWNENLVINDDSEFIFRLLPLVDEVIFAAEAIAYYRYTTENNLSSYSNKNDVNEAINSWETIELNLKKIYKKDCIAYMEIIKASLYINVKNSFPELAFQHHVFFKKQLKEYKFLVRLKNKIKKIIRIK